MSPKLQGGYEYFSSDNVYFNLLKLLTKMKKTILIVLLILNAIVLLGQVWPEGAPPFAKTINIVFLVCNLLFFIFLVTRKRV